MRNHHAIAPAACGLILLATGCLATRPAMGQSAYFSLEGEFNAAGDQHDFFFDLSRSVGSGEDLRFRSYANAGGTNAAGDIIAAGGIDSVLELFDSGNMQRGFDDDGTGGLDSLLSWPGVAVIDLVPLNPDPLAAGGYRLNLREFSNVSIGPWAVDLIGPADAIAFGDAVATGASTIDSLKFGTTGFGAAAAYNHHGTLTLTDQLVVAPTGSADLNVTSGTITVGGLATVNTGGTLAITGGTFTTGSNVTVHGGTLSRNGGSFELGGGQTLSAENNAQINFTGLYEIGQNTTFDIGSGADFSTTSILNVGSGTNGTLIVEGFGSSLTTSTINTALLDWGAFGGTGTVTIRDNATATIGATSIEFAPFGHPASSGILSVESGADMTVNSLNLAAGPIDPGGTASVTVTGTGSTLTQNGSSTLNVGGSGMSTATFSVTDDGEFTSGTGAITVNPSGSIVIKTFGRFYANGDVTIDGGTLSRGVQDNFLLPVGGSLTAENGALVNFAGSHQLDQGGTITIKSGADFTLAGNLVVGSITNGTLIVEGTGSSLTTNTADTFSNLVLGFWGATGTLTIRDNATAAIGEPSIDFASFGDPPTSGILNVESGADVTVNSLDLASVAAGAATVTVTGAGSTLTQNGASTLTVGGFGASTAMLGVANGGTFTTGTGAIAVNPTGSIDINNGIFNANGNMTIDGGTLLVDDSAFSFNLTSGGSLTAQNGALVSFAGSYELDEGTTFTIANGADFTLTHYLDVGNATNGTLTVEGIGSSLTTSTFNTAVLDWGLDGGTGSVTIRDNATATINAIDIVLARLGNPASSGVLSVESGATMTSNALNLAPGAAGNASVTVTGAGSSITQNGASTLTVGGSGASTATLNVADSGVFTTGSGAINVHATGAFNLGAGGVGGTFNANGPITIDGGTFSRDYNSFFNFAAGNLLSAQNGAQVNFTGFYELDDGTTFTISDGADFTTTDFLDVGNTTDGTLVVEGTGSSLTTNTVDAIFLDWGRFGGTATVTIRDNATATIGGTFIEFADYGNPASSGILSVESGADMTANSLDLATGAAGNASITVTGTGSTLTQNGASTLTVGGSGTSTATLNVDDSGTFTTGTGATQVNATGSIHVGTGMTGGTFNANGPMTIDGAVSLTNGEMTAGMVTLGGGAFNFTGGVLHVDDFIGNLDNQGGTLAPGNSPGITNVTGDYTNQSSATVEIEIDSGGGIPGSDFDQVNISGTANLDGALFVALGMALVPGDFFEVMTFGSHNGVFSSVTDSGLPDCLVMAPFYTATDLTLSVQLLGDASGNGQVGPEDYTLWANGFGMPEPSYDDGDLSRNGIVGPEDYTIWANKFGTVVMGPAPAKPVAPGAVPEPSSLVLLLIGAAGLLWRRTSH